MEVYYLHKEGIPITKATNITLQNFIVYQISLVLTGLIAIIYNAAHNLFPNNGIIKKLVILGFLINLLVLVVTYIISFGKRINQFILKKGIHTAANLKIIKNEEQTQAKFKEYFNTFHKNAIELRKKRHLLIIYVLINMLGLTVLYSMPYIISTGLGQNISLIKTVVTTAYVMIIGSFIPIPVVTWGIEYSFIYFYSFFIKGSILNAIMLVWRFVSYYVGVIIGAISLSLYRKKDKKW